MSGVAQSPAGTIVDIDERIVSARAIGDVADVDVVSTGAIDDVVAAADDRPLARRWAIAANAGSHCTRGGKGRDAGQRARGTAHVSKSGPVLRRRRSLGNGRERGRFPRRERGRLLCNGWARGRFPGCHGRIAYSQRRPGRGRRRRACARRADLRERRPGRRRRSRSGGRRPRDIRRRPLRGLRCAGAHRRPGGEIRATPATDPRATDPATTPADTSAAASAASTGCHWRDRRDDQTCDQDGRPEGTALVVHWILLRAADFRGVARFTSPGPAACGRWSPRNPAPPSCRESDRSPSSQRSPCRAARWRSSRNRSARRAGPRWT